MDFRNSASPGCNTACEISLFGFYKISQNNPANNNQTPAQTNVGDRKPLPNPLLVGPDTFFQAIKNAENHGFNPLIVYGLAFSAIHVNARAFNDQNYKKLAEAFNQAIVNILTSDPAMAQILIANPILYHLGLKPEDLVKFYSGSLFASLDYHYNLKSNDPAVTQLRQNYENYVHLVDKVRKAIPVSPQISQEKQLEYQSKLLVMEWVTTSFNLNIDSHLATMSKDTDEGKFSNLIKGILGICKELSKNRFISPVIQILQNQLMVLGLVPGIAWDFLGVPPYLTKNVIEPYRKYKAEIGDGRVAMKLVLYDLIANHLENNPALSNMFNIRRTEELAKLSLQANLPPTFDEYVTQVKTDLQGKSAIEMGLPEGVLRTPGMYIGGGLGALLGLALVAIYNLFAGKKSKTSYWAYLIAAVLGAVLGGYGGYSFGRHFEESPLIQT
jgi:hypothetical protein